MASSFIDQTPAIINLVKRLNPKTILDIGKGFGKYGFLLHEYIGIDNSRKLDPEKSLRELSKISIDAVEIDPDLMLPHLDQLYRKIYFGDVLTIFKELPKYDVVLMIDIIEHIEKNGALQLLTHLVGNGSKVIIATPRDFFEQNLYESEFEKHVSHWTLKDFQSLGHLDSQNFDAGAVYLLSPASIDIRGFGNSWIKKLRRIARAVKNEL